MFDLELLYSKKEISNVGVFTSLKQYVKNAKFFITMGIEKGAKEMLENFIKELNIQKEKHISESAYDILRPQAEYLLFSI